MWGALIRVGARYAFFRRWKNTLILIGGVLLCAITAFLIDAKMYLSAFFIGVLAAAVMISLALHYLRERRAIRDRERQKAAQAVKRAAAAEARSEKIGRVKATAAGMAKGMTGTAAGIAKGVAGSAAGAVNVAKTRYSGARDRLGSWRSKPERDEPKA